MCKSLFLLWLQSFSGNCTVIVHRGLYSAQMFLVSVKKSFEEGRWMHRRKTCCPVFGVWGPVTAFALGCSNFFFTGEHPGAMVNPRASACSCHLTRNNSFWPRKSSFISGRDRDLFWLCDEEGDSCSNSYSKDLSWSWHALVIGWNMDPKWRDVLPSWTFTTRCRKDLRPIPSIFFLLANVKSFPLNMIIWGDLTLKFLFIA